MGSPPLGPLRLDARGLSVEVGGKRLLHDINLSFKGGELVAVLGPSGSGKSTLLMALMGFRPSSGSLRLLTQELPAHFEALKGSIGFVSQDDVVQPKLTVERTIEHACRLRLPMDMPLALLAATARSVIEAVGLTDRASVRVGRLSGGQRKRVAIAVELVAKPPLLFLDEPTSGLDPLLEEKTMQLFRSLTTRERLTVVTTHVLASLDMVDLLVILSRGRLVYVGPPKEAPAFFEVADLPSIYRKLGAGPAEPWSARLLGTALYRRFVIDRQREVGS